MQAVSRSFAKTSADDVDAAAAEPAPPPTLPPPPLNGPKCAAAAFSSTSATSLLASSTSAASSSNTSTAAPANGTSTHSQFSALGTSRCAYRPPPPLHPWQCPSHPLCSLYSSFRYTLGPVRTQPLPLASSSSSISQKSSPARPSVPSRPVIFTNPLRVATTVSSSGQQDLDGRNGATSPQHKRPPQRDIPSGSSGAEDRFHSGEDNSSLQQDYAEEEGRWRESEQNQGKSGTGQQKESLSDACEFSSLHNSTTIHGAAMSCLRLAARSFSNPFAAHDTCCSW